MKKILIFFGCICIFIIGAFLLWNQYFQQIHINSNKKPNSPPILTDVEKKFAENPENIRTILANTQAILAGSSKNGLPLEQYRLELEHATESFYRKNLDAIALSFYQNSDKTMYQKAFQKFGTVEIKADITSKYAVALKSKIQGGNIDPKSEEFLAYTYIIGRLHDSPKVGSGGLDKNTLDFIKLAEKGTLKQTDILLENAEMIQVFDTLGYLPWRELDLKTMRRIITSEGLSTETKYTKAYLTAQMMFGRNILGNRINLKNTFDHKKQIASLSCEANSATHFYNYYAKLQSYPTITEKQMFDWFPLDDKLPEIQQTKTGILRKWGDPDKVFVGKVEGRQSANVNRLTGYGIHAKGVEPILANKLSVLGYTPSLQTFSEMNIVLSLASNNPVLFWYVFTDDAKKGFTRLDWITWDGQNRIGYIGEHTGIIVGVEFSKGGELAKVGYYEGLSEKIIWEDWNSLKNKAKYFDTVITASS